ncbi:MAG TPA: helix-turn-helix domain-containing protein [Candidatus Dormibacteraeota bacterium]|nr:helix-turn-helix domain-containing protein [Candidatus Dormibacteraeota bacterium]
MDPELTARERLLAAARAGLGRGERPAVAAIAAEAGVSKSTFFRVFGSRRKLFDELDAGPEPDRRRAVLDAAAELLARDGLARLSMDELAAQAGVSRAWLYRLYPGKAALFAELIRVFSPMEVVVATTDRLRGQPPELALPELAVSVWQAVSQHLGVVRPLLFEAMRLGPDVRETVTGVVAPQMLGAIGGYLVEQMEAGALRPMHPVLAVQAFVGPIIFHLILRPVLVEGLGIELDTEAAVREFALNFVRGMAPD